MNQNILDSLVTLAKEKPPEVRNFRICAGVVLKHKEVISLGFPRKKSHPIQKEFGRNEHSVFLHAEVEALLRARRIVELDDSYALYVARVKHRGAQDDSFIMGNAKPCEGCMRFISSFGITQIIYTDSGMVG